MLTFLLHSLRENGCAWVIRRSLYEAQFKSGVLARRFPARPWNKHESSCEISDEPAPGDPALFAAWKQSSACFWSDQASTNGSVTALRGVLGECGLANLRNAADAALAGGTVYFFDQTADTGFPPDWRSNPFIGGRADDPLHWSRQPMWSPEYGDIKYVWEPGRFAAAYLLSRAYRTTGDPRYANGFWELVESFYEHNPPNTGPHWKCGQEMALRIMACAFALDAVARSEATTPERFGRLIRIIATHADRIDANHVYAHLQQNNHAMSEGTGLFAAGVLFPFLRRARSWRERGQLILEKEARLLIRADGTFNQKSHNYHRLMLQDYLYALCLAERNGIEFADDVHNLVARAIDYLCQVLDRESGTVPNFGANDGALITPLNSCDFVDFRPVCQAGRYFLDRARWLDPGPCDEDLFWLFGREALASERSDFRQCECAAAVGGCYTLRGQDTWMFTHCESFKSRPSQADALHMDLWWRGQNIACDAGTYLYYAESPWNNGLAGTDVHNTVMVDGCDQLDRGPRFMWSRWHDSPTKGIQVLADGRLKVWDGEHHGYRRLVHPVTHRRSVLLIDGKVWVVIDTLAGEADHCCRLHWLLADVDYDLDAQRREITLHTEQGDYFVAVRTLFPGNRSADISLVRADGDGTRGWVSRYYGRRDPAISLAIEVEGALPGRFVSVLAESKPIIDQSGDRLLIRSGDSEIGVTFHHGGFTVEHKGNEFCLN